jgi:hypothetical protein
MEAYMKNNPSRRRSLAVFSAFSVLGLVPLAAQAADYTYVEGGFIERHDYGESGPGGRVAGSVDLRAIPLAIIGEYDGTDGLSQFDAGAIFHMPINRELDFFAGATLEHVDRDGKGVNDNDTGVGGRIGLRWQANQQVELAPEVRVVHLYHEDQATVRLNALFNLMPHLDLQGAVQGGDEQRYEVGLRYNFGRRF